MKHIWFKPGAAATAAILFLTVLLSACSKNNPSPATPVAGLMAFNLAPDKNAVGFNLSGSAFTSSPMAYSQYSGFYLDVATGAKNVEAYENTSTIIASTPTTFMDKKYYSAFFMGNNGNYRNVVVLDNIDTLTARGGVAYIRWVNAIPDSSKPTATITLQGNNISSGSIGFTTVSQFVPLIPGDIKVSLSGAGASISRTVTVEAKKIYTLFLQGVPGHTDAQKTVQIKSVLNGQVE